MNIKVSDSFKNLTNRVDCRIIISEAWLGETDQGFTPNKNNLIQIPANGIWEEETTTLKVLVIIPDEHIINNNDLRQEYGAIYFFSSTDSDEPAFILYDIDEPLSLGRNLINIDFSGIKASIKMVDTSEDTIFLETFGQNPGKNIYLTENESSLVSKNTYYVYWRVKTTNDDTTDLPALDPNGKLITENYTYKTYSNLRISCPGLTRTTIPHSKFGLSDNGGVVPIIGIADFIEYKVFGGVITETIRGEITIDDIPGSEIVYISGHNDLGQVVSEAFNIFTPNNYSSMIEYKKNDYPGSYGADGIFGLRIRYFDVKEQKPVIVNSINQIKLVRRDVADNWFIIDRSSRFVEDTEEFGEVPVFMFPYDTNGSEYFIIRTKFIDPITDISQITITNENEIINDLFRVDLSLNPYTDENGTYYVDIYVRLTALTVNTDTINWAPIVDGVSTLFYTKISYQDYFSVVYLIQKPKIEGSLKLVDQNGVRVNQIRMRSSETSKSYFVVCDEEEDPRTDFDNRPAWKIIESPEGVRFDSDSGYLSPETRPSYPSENRLTVNYTTSSTTAQNIYLTDIKLARIKESGIPEDLMTTTNWRNLVDIAQINIGFMKYGRNIEINTTPLSLSTIGIGLYELNIQTNCRFVINSSDHGVLFRKVGEGSYSSSIESPLYSDPRYSNGRSFKYWVQMQVVTEVQPSSRGPISIIATEEDRSTTRSININQSLVSDYIYKLKDDGTPFSNGSWNYTSNPDLINQAEWVKRYARNSNNSLNITTFNTSTTYSPGDVVKYNTTQTIWNETTTYNAGDVVYYDGNSWKSNRVNTGSRPGFNKELDWICITKFFVCIRQITSTLLRDPQTFPMVQNSNYWQEISAVNGLQDLNTKITSVHSAPMFDPTKGYVYGDIVRYGYLNPSIGFYNASTQYHLGDIIKIGTGDPYNCYKCISYNNPNYLSGIMPGFTEGWEIYWEYSEQYNGYICNKDTNSSVPGQSPNWSPIVDDFINLQRNRRLIAVRQLSRLYLFTNLELTVSCELTPENIWEEVNNRLGEEQVDDIFFILNNPSLFRTGFSLGFHRRLSSGTVDPNTRSSLPTLDLYLYVERDNTWVELDDLDTLVDMFNSQYNDSYFLIPSRQISLLDYKNKIKYSYLIAPGDVRSIYSIQNLIIGSDLADITEQSNKTDFSYLFPYYSSYSNLPGLNCVVRDNANKFFKIICRISDGGVIRASIINPSISNQFRSNNILNPNSALTYYDEWDHNKTYNTNDVVCYSNLGKSKLYYKCLEDSVFDVNPSIDTTGKWQCLSWSALPTTVVTDEDAINTVKGPNYLNLISTDFIGVRGTFNVGTSIFNATKQIVINEHPSLGDIIRIGTTYYYYSLWTVVDFPTTQSEVDSLITSLSETQQHTFLRNQNYFLCKGFSNVLIKNPIYNKYYYLNSHYVFNNIGANKYIFIPEYSMDNTNIKYHTRKTPNEDLQQVAGNSVFISNHTTPEFNEWVSIDNHYIDHFSGLKLNAPNRSTVPQVQADYKGKLTLSNPVNQTTSTTLSTQVLDIFGNLQSGIFTNDLRIDTTKVTFNLYKRPYSPSIRLLSGNTEITSINLENFFDPNNLLGCTTVIDVVSPFPIEVSKTFSILDNNPTDPITAAGWNFSYSLSYPRVERDGYYHYKLSVIPNSNNDSTNATPIKLGDLYFLSKIKKNGTKPTEWVAVEDSETGIEILKTLLRTDTLKILNLNSNLNDSGYRISMLPSLDKAIPGLVYRGNMAVIGNVFSFDDMIIVGDPISGYSETKLFVAIPHNFVIDNDVNDIEKYFYSQEEIDREYGVYLRRISVVQRSSYNFEVLGNKTTDIDFLGETRNYNLVVRGSNSWNGRYLIGNEENCVVTNNEFTGDITMTVPTRIPNYSPKLISDTYYTELKDKLSVSFDVLVNSVSNSGIIEAGQSIRLAPGSSISSTMSQFISGTYNNTHYRDDYSRVGMFIRTIEKYNYLDTDINTQRTGYTYQKTTWNTISDSDLPVYVEEHNRKYRDNVDLSRRIGALYGLSGIDVNNTNQELPSNIDDILGYGYYKVETPNTNDPKILVDNSNWPNIAQFGTFYTTDNISFVKFCPCSEDATSYPNYYNIYQLGTPTLKNAESVEDAYVDLGINTNFMWEEITEEPIMVQEYNSCSIEFSLPIPNKNNFKTNIWYWKKANPYTATTTYNVGDLAITIDKLWRCKENGTIGVTPTSSTTEWEVVSSTFNTDLSSISELPREVGYGGNILTDYYMIGGYCYKATQVYCTTRPIYGLISITEPIDTSNIVQIDNPTYEYYKINRFPIGTTWRDLPLSGSYVVDETSEMYARKTFPVFGIIGITSFYEYYRKQISIPSTDLCNSTTSEVYFDRVFKVFYNGSYKYFQLKKNPDEILAPSNYRESTTSSSVGYLGNSEYPGNLMLMNDGVGRTTLLSDTLIIDFNDFSYKIQSYEERIDLKQKRSTKGIVSNFGELSKDLYRLYLGDFPEKNTITINIDPEDTEVSGMIGLFNTTTELFTNSNVSGSLPGYNIISSPGCNIITSQSLPRLDSGQTDNIKITFEPNNSDRDLIHDFEFYTSEDGFNTRLYLRIIQKSEPGEVTILGSSNLYFLSNGLLQNPRNSSNFLDFNSTLDINLNNIEILNEFGEDMLDRGDEENPVSYVSPVSITNGSIRYRAFLKLKPNTTNYEHSGFRIKIGKVSGNTVTDRTIVGEGRFYKYTESGWVLLGSEYTPSWLEKYVTELPSSANVGDIVCICTSLRGYQGYYSVALFNPNKTADFENATGIEYRRAETGEEISDLKSALGIDEGINLNSLATIISESELPDIKQQKQVGLIYKIGNVYYYTYSDYITSGFVYGSPGVPIIIGDSSEDDQKFHLKVTQLEYNSAGYVTTTNLTNTIFNLGQNYTLDNSRSSMFSGIGEDEINRINTGYYNSQIIYSNTSMMDFVPYLRTWYEFYEQSDIDSTITIKAIIDLQLKYNYSGPNIPESYKKIDNTFTLYIRKI